METNEHIPIFVDEIFCKFVVVFFFYLWYCNKGSK